MPPIRIGQHGRAKKGTLKKLLRQLFAKHKVGLIISAICILFNVFGNLSSSIFANFITTALTKAISEGKNPFVDFVNISQMGIPLTTNVTVLLITLGVIYTIGVFVSWTWNRTMAIITQKFMNDFRIALFNHMQDLPIRYFDTHAHGSIMSIYTNDIDTIRQFISQCLPAFLQTGLTIIVVFLAMLMNSVWLTLVVIFFVTLMMMNIMGRGKTSAKYSLLQQQSLSKVEGNIEETINGLKVIKVFSHEEKSFEDFSVLNKEYQKNATTARVHGEIMMPINGNLGNFMYVVTAIVGILILVVPGFYNLSLTGFAPIDKTSFYGIIISFLMMTRMFSNNISNFSQQVIFMVMGMAGASRCYDLLDEKVEEDGGYVSLVRVKKDENGTMVETDERTRYFAWKHPHGNGSTTYTEMKGDILLENVDFSYVEGTQILHDINIYAHPGERIALVGATGAGKTTITNLLNRFYDIQDGKIRYDGINIRKIKKDDLRKSLGIVLQDVNLFSGTVMENIRYGRLDATDEEVYEAAKIANAYDFITRLPQGFNTVLNANGSNLSQGQRQLISIARAAVADAPVMILDEATSSIDTRTEKLVQDGMDRLMEGRTTFVIAHRLSTIQNSDCIMVMDHGRIIERGTHDDLIKEKGVYYQLYTGAFELD